MTVELIESFRKERVIYLEDKIFFRDVFGYQLLTRNKGCL